MGANSKFTFFSKDLNQLELLEWNEGGTLRVKKAKA